MSIANEITNYANGLGEAYDAAEDMGAIMPNDKNMNNLDTTIRTIPQPIVNDATLTIQKNGTTVQTFTANQATDATANITVPTKTSDLTNDSGYLSVVDWDIITNKPTFASVATSGSYTDLSNTPNLATVATSGSYTDLSNKPTIGNATLTIQKNGTTLSTFTANATSNKTINIPIPTTAADVSALPDSTKYGASITMSIDNTTYKITTTLKDQDGNTLGSAQEIDLPLESVVVSGSFDSVNKKIVLVLENGNTVDIPVGDLVAGLQTEITANNKLSADLVDDTNTTHKFVTAANKTTWNGKQDALTAGNNIQINGTTISATDTTYSTMTGATGSADGAGGLVPKPVAGDDTKYLSGDGTWKTVSQYSLPIASASTLGGIKVGANLTINSSTGVLSADAQPAKLYSTTGQNTDGAMTQKATTDQLALKANSADLATVATSGSYNDLSNKPTIPTVNNATLTIQKNGTTVKTFTANASSNVTANITVPTKTSDITNDSNFPVDASYVHTDNNFTTTLKNKLDGIATGAEVNQNAFSNVKVGSSTIAADGKTDTLEIAAGSNISLAADTTNDKVTITGKNMVRTNDNLSPSEDTTAAWATLFNTTSTTGVDVTEGYFVTWYSVANKFANQPSAYGFLETFRKGSDFYQRWHTQSSGAILYRSGNGSGWSSPNTGAFNTVATTGQLPTVNNGTLTIQKNGTNVATFTANQSTAATANITVPTQTSDLTNNSNFVADASYVHTDNNFTTTLKNKLDGIASGAEVNVQSDWNVTDSSSDAFIKNKPTIPTVNNATLTIQKNGTNVQTFTANSSSNKTANITVPTKVSELTSDAGGNMFIGTCGTAAATAAKAVTVSADQNFALKVGAIVAVKFTNTNTASTPTINVNSTGAKNIWYNTTSYTGSGGDIGGYANKYIYYVYDGTYWVWLGMGVENNTTYSSMSVAEGTAGTATNQRVMRADYLKQIIEGVRPIDSTMSESSTNAIQNGVISNKVNQLDRFTRALVPFGTAIAANKNLNTLEFMKVQKFYCSSNATTATLTNCPTGGVAFMMEVFSPLSTTVDNEQTAWCYRTRIITDLNGNMYVQSASSNGSAVWSYGAWKRIAWKSEVDAKPNITMSSTDPGTGSTLAANNYIAVYGGSDASITTTDIVDGAVTNDKIAEGTIGASRLNNLSRFRAGEWVKIGEARVTTNTSGTAFMTVNIPSDYQSQHAQYRVEGGMEVINVNGRQNFLSLQPMIGSTWMVNCFYSAQRVWGGEWAWYGASGSTGYNGTTAIFGFEWCFQSDWDSCDFSVLVSNAYPGSHWCANCTAGGMSGGHPGTFTGGGRVQSGNALTGFRIQCGSAVTMGAGSTLTVYGRLRPTY